MKKSHGWTAASDAPKMVPRECRLRSTKIALGSCEISEDGEVGERRSEIPGNPVRSWAAENVCSGEKMADRSSARKRENTKLNWCEFSEIQEGEIMRSEVKN